MTSRVVLVTGGGTRIGAAVARQLSKAGDQVVICGRRAAPLQTVAEQTGALPVVADVSEATRQRERAMKRSKSIRHAQRFLSAFSGTSPHFRPRRHLLSAAEYRLVMADRFAVWNGITGTTAT